MVEPSNNEKDSSDEEGQYRCHECAKTFKKRFNLTRHMTTTKSHTKAQPIKCGGCTKLFYRQDHYARHTKTCQSANDEELCKHCNKFIKRRYMKKHKNAINRKLRLQANAERVKDPANGSKTTGPIGSAEQSPKPAYSGPFTQIQKAFGRNLMRFRIEGDETDRDPDTYLKETEENLTHLTEYVRNELNMFKIQLTLHVEFFKPTNMDEKCQNPFWSLPLIIQPTEDIPTQLHNLFPKIIKSHSEFMRKSSGWVTKKISHLDVHIARYKPLRAGCTVKLPPYL